MPVNVGAEVAIFSAVEHGIIPLTQARGLAMDDNKAKALAAALAQIEKQFGKGSVRKMGEGSGA